MRVFLLFNYNLAYKRSPGLWNIRVYIQRSFLSLQLDRDIPRHRRRVLRISTKKSMFNYRWKNSFFPCIFLLLNLFIFMENNYAQSSYIDRNGARVQAARRIVRRNLFSCRAHNGNFLPPVVSCTQTVLIQR